MFPILESEAPLGEKKQWQRYVSEKTVLLLRRIGMVLFLVSLILAVFPLHSAIRRAYAANACVWTGAVNSNWDTAGNWTSCGGVAPAADDTVTFNSSYNVAANINSASTVTVAGLAIDTGYTATVTQSQTIIVNGNLSQAAGAFTGGAAAITASGDFTLSGGTFTSTSGNLSVGGSWSRTAGTFTHNSGTVTFTSTATGKTLTVGSQSFANLTFNGAGGGWTFQDAVTATGAITLTAGGLNTNGQTINAASFASSNSNTRSLTLGASSITLSAGGGVFAWNLGTVTGLTFDAGTSTITMTGSNLSAYYGFNGGGRTYNAVSITGSGSPAVWGANTFANLTRTGTAVKTDTLQLRASQIISGTLTLAGNSASNRLLVTSITPGTAMTLTAAAVSVSNTDFSDITGAGVAAPFTGTSLGNALGNTGITITTAADQYWVGNGGSWSDANHWASTSGGTGGTGRVPLPQDTAYINANSITAASQTIGVDMPRLGTNINYTGTANSPTLSHSATATIYGSLTLASGVGTISGGYYGLTLASRSAANITSAGKTFGNGTVAFSGIGGAFTLQDSITANSTIYIYNGTFSASTYNVTATVIDIAGAGAARTVNMGSGTWTATGTGTVWNMGASGSTTFNSDTSTITFSDISANAKTFDGEGKAYYDFSINNAGTSNITFTGANSFHNLAITGAARTVILPASATTTITNSFDINGTASYTVTLNSSSSGTAATLSKTSGTVSVDYLSIRDITAAGGATWYAGANSTNVSGNTGWTFSAPPSLSYYWVGGDGSWSSASHWASSSGGVGGAGNPSNTDAVVFDTNSAASAVTVDAGINVRGISMTADFSGSISQGANSVTVGADGYTQAGGTFTGGSAAIAVSGDFSLSGGALTATTNTLSVGGNWSKTAGAFTHNSGTVSLISTSGGKTLTAGGQSFSHLTFNGSGGGWALQDTLTLAGNLTVAAGTLTINNQNINLAGNLSVVNGAGWTKGSGTLTLNGSNQNLSDANSTTNDLGAVVTSGAGTATLVGNLRVTTMSIGNGTTLNLGAGSYTLTLTGTGTPITTNASGTFSKGTGSTVNYAGAGTATNVVTLAYHSLAFNPASSTTYSLSGHLTSGNALTGSVTIGANATLDATASNYNISLAGNWSNSGSFTAQNGTVTLNGGNQTISGTTTFNNLTKQVTSAYTLTFTASSTQTVTGTLTLNGAASQLLALRSSSDSTSWNLVLNGSGAVSYGDVKDSNLTVNSIAPVNCTNGGNNSALWLFPINVGVNAYTTASPNPQDPTCLASSTSLGSIVVGDCLFFSGSASGTITLYEWDFDGNGTYDWSSTSTGNITHVMPIVGTFTSRFRVTYNDGSKLSAALGTPITVAARSTSIYQLEKTGLVVGRSNNNDTYSASNEAGDLVHSFDVAPDGSYAVYAYLSPGGPGWPGISPVAELHVAQSGESPGDLWTDVFLRKAQAIQDHPAVYDAHFDPSVAIDEQGYIHVVGAMHNQPWAYWRSNSPNTIADGFEYLGADTSSIDPIEGATGSNSNYTLATESYRLFYQYTSSALPGTYISYPRFFRSPSGKIYLVWRGRDTDCDPNYACSARGAAGDWRSHEGYVAMASYNSAPGVRAWSYTPDSGTYTNIFDVSSNIASHIVRDYDFSVGGAEMAVEPSTAAHPGRIHLFWVWGKYLRSWDGKASGNDLSHAQSDDGGTTWTKTDSTAYTLPITHGQAEIIVPRANNHEYYYTPTPNTGYTGSDSFNVLVDDGSHFSNTAAVTVNVLPTGSTAPVAHNQGITTAQNTAVNVTLTGYDPNGNTMTYTRAAPSSGTLSGSSTGTITGTFTPDFTYTPDNNYTGSDSFTFTVNDGTTTSSPATITITTVAPGGTTPVAFSQTVTTLQNTLVYIRSYGGYNPDGGNLVYKYSMGQNIHDNDTVATAHGSLSYIRYDTSTGDGKARDEITANLHPAQIDSAGNIYQYTNNGFYPPYANQYRLVKYTAATSSWSTDAVASERILNGLTNLGDDLIYNVKVTGGNVTSTDGYVDDNPAGYYANQIGWGVTGATTLVRERWQLNNYARSFYILLGPTTTVTGQLKRDAYFVRRTGGTAINRKPVLATVGQQTGDIDAPVSVTISGSDLDSDSLTYSATNLPTGASFNAETATFSWTPATGQVGLHDVTFSVTDGTLTDSETVPFSISGAHAPVANAQSVSTNQNTETDITLTGYDSQGHNLTYTVASQPTHGTLSGITPNITYTPDTDYTGSDAFTFTVNDGTTDSSASTVSIMVSAPAPGNNAPTANAQSVSTNESVARAITLTGFDPDSNPLTYSVVTQPSNGTLTGTAPNLTYTPSGNYSSADSFTFRVYDGTEYSPPATITITVIADSNNVPSATAQAVSVNQDTDLSITLAGTDADDDSLTYTVVSQPTHGTLSGTAPNLTYSPTSRYTGDESFAFKTHDGNEYSAIATISITVINTNNAPIASSQSVTVSQDSSASITLTGSDGDADTLTYTVASSPAHGSLSGDAPDLTYTPTAGYSGTDSFTFTVYDGQENSTTSGTVSITVSAVPITAAAITEDTTATGGNVDSVISKATGGVIAKAKAEAAKAAIEEGGAAVGGAAQKVRKASAGRSEATAATRAAVTLAVTVGLGGGATGIIWLFRPQLLAQLLRKF